MAPSVRYLWQLLMHIDTHTLFTMLLLVPAVQCCLTKHMLSN
jgi:hypothetical protein